MGKTYQLINDQIKAWLNAQPMFFIATSPLASDGHINLSPKGHDTLRIIDQTTIAFADYGGSGIETVAHLRENKRIVLMACAFSGPPKIIRLHGKGEVVLSSDEEFSVLESLWSGSPLGIRAIIKINVTRISDSCGYGVPLMELQGQRETSISFAQKKGSDTIRDYIEANNRISIDGLPGLSKEEAHDYRGPEELAAATENDGN